MKTKLILSATFILLSYSSAFSQVLTSFDKVNVKNSLSLGGTAEARAFFDCTNLSSNTLKSVLARLGEGDNLGEGTFLGVKSYSTATAGVAANKTKSFAIEHIFRDNLNSSINFYRGGSHIGGYITFGVHDGTETYRFYRDKFEANCLIRATEVKVETGWWSDFVFDKDYKLPTLSEVESHIQTYNCLPDIPSEAEVKENGINLGDMQARLLQKIEELTLYVIDQHKENKDLKKQLESQGMLIKALQEQMINNK